MFTISLAQSLWTGLELSFPKTPVLKGHRGGLRSVQCESTVINDNRSFFLFLQNLEFFSILQSICTKNIRDLEDDYEAQICGSYRRGTLPYMKGYSYWTVPKYRTVRLSDTLKKDPSRRSRAPTRLPDPPTNDTCLGAYLRYCTVQCRTHSELHTASSYTQRVGGPPVPDMYQ